MKNERDQTDDLAISIDIEPKPQGRPRFRIRKNGRAWIYQDEVDKLYKKTIALEALATMRMAGFSEPIGGPIGIEFIFSMGERRNGAGYPLGKPDLDNLCKAVLDAFCGIVFHDDAQVVRLRAGKSWGRAGILAVVKQL